MNAVAVRSGKALLCKFLMLKGGTLLFGFFPRHHLLWETYCVSLGKPEDADKRPELAGAGAVENEGKVQSWESIGYGVETPYGLQPPVEEYFAGQSALLHEMFREARQ